MIGYTQIFVPWNLFQYGIVQLYHWEFRSCRLRIMFVLININLVWVSFTVSLILKAHSEKICKSALMFSISDVIFFSELYSTVSSVYKLISPLNLQVFILLMYTRNRVGPKVDPWGSHHTPFPCSSIHHPV